MSADTQKVEGRMARPPSKARLGLMVVGALAAASVITVGFILPAEFHQDPTGFGRATGLYKLGAPQPKSEVVAAAGTTRAAIDYPAPFRSDFVEIPLAAGGDPRRGDELEYKVHMKAGDSLVYAMTVEGAPAGQFYYDFHGETPAAGQAAAKVVEYRQTTGIASNGTLVAPIPGVHGWYLQNQSAKPVVVKLKLAGFYELVPPGEYGNEGGVNANLPASKSMAVPEG